MKSADKIYLLMEILGHKIDKIREERYQQFLDSQEYEDMYKDLWMIRIQQGSDVKAIAERLNEVKNKKVSSYYDVIALEKEVEVITEKGIPQLTINPYVYNSHLKMEEKTIGEIKINYTQMQISINQYILGSDISDEKKIRFLNNVAIDWCHIAGNDIEEGIKRVSEDINTVSEIKKPHFPLLSFLQVLLATIFFTTFSALLFSGNTMFERIRSGNFTKGIVMTVIITVLLASSFLGLLFLLLLKLKGKFLKTRALNKLYICLKLYQDLLANLAIKHEMLLSEIARVVNAKEGKTLKLLIEDTAVITPSNYFFDSFRVDLNSLTKKGYRKKNKLLFIFSYIFFATALALSIVSILKYRGVL